MRGLAFLIVLLAALAQAPAAFAHASLVRAEPADGAILAQPPAVLTLTFNEPVSPLVVRLIGPNGEIIAPAVTAENATVSVTPPALRPGTHALSWRVVSADGHPVGGSLVFSVGAPSDRPDAQQIANAGVRPALWAAKVLIYAGLFIGIGGAFFRAWITRSQAYAGSARLAATLATFLVAGLLATPVSVGLQGLDALDLPLAGLMQMAAWQAGLATSYGLTAVAAAVALLAGIAALAARSARIARGASLLGLLGVGLALTLSGHAGTVEPRLLTRSSVFLHGVGVAVWIGALLPLLVAIRQRDDGGAALMRFTRLIPYPLAVLAISGATLAVVQLGRVDDLWTTRYGVVLACKLGLVMALLGLAAANRFVFAPRVQAGDGSASRLLATSIKFELAIAVAILALVALWRFAPPPRALAAPAQVSIHLHGARAMAQIEIAPRRAGGARVDLLVLDAELRPLAVKEVTLVLSNAAVGIESLRRDAISAGDAAWRIDDLRIPIAGRWRLRVEILISDFEKVAVEDQVDLPHVP